MSRQQNSKPTIPSLTHLPPLSPLFNVACFLVCFCSFASFEYSLKSENSMDKMLYITFLSWKCFEISISHIRKRMINKLYFVIYHSILWVSYLKMIIVYQNENEMNENINQKIKIWNTLLFMNYC